MKDNKEIKGVIDNLLQQLDGLYNGKSWVTEKIGENIFSYAENQWRLKKLPVIHIL
ncbi:hypothetical protein [Ginsengibacter hankyongi]|uniref:hypothetical protein n=1 Tax=Ginsengibacter hankyongi TaxID=2607284 RepID=UPI001928D79B|nr:hypothetical protein [Ginsengibacter hankyongi]